MSKEFQHLLLEADRNLSDPMRQYEGLRDITCAKTKCMLDPSGRPTAFKVDECIAIAGKWWTDTGRRLMPKPDTAALICSGIAMARKWDKLTVEERIQITRTWYIRIGVFTKILGVDNPSKYTETQLTELMAAYISEVRN